MISTGYRLKSEMAPQVLSSPMQDNWTALNHIVDRALNESATKIEASEKRFQPCQKTAHKISRLFRQLIAAIQRHPILTIGAIGISAGLGATLPLTGAVVGIVAGAALLGLALTLTTLKIVALIHEAHNRHSCRVINQLELAGYVTTQEAYALKNALSQPNVYQTLLEKQFSRWKTSKLFSADECTQLARLLDRKGANRTFKEIQKLAFDSSGETKPKSCAKNIKEEIQACINQMKSAYVRNKLTEALNSSDQNAFRSALIAHYQDIGKLEKQKGDLISSYRCQDLVKKIAASRHDEIFATFVRLKRQEALFETHDQVLAQLSKGLNEIYALGLDRADEMETMQEKLGKLHQVTSQLLADYRCISSEVDELFAVYRGNFAQKYRGIGELLTKMNGAHAFAELPLSPGQEAAKAAPNPRKVLEERLEAIKQKLKQSPISALEEEAKEIELKLEDFRTPKERLEGIKQKLEKRDQLKPHVITQLEAEEKSLERSLRDRQTVEKKKTENGFAETFTSTDKKSILIATCSFGTGHKTAANALKTHIGDAAHVTIIDPTEYDTGIFVKETDWLYKLGRRFGKKWSAVQAFNWILQEQKYWMVNFENKVDRIICKIFKKQKNGIAAAARGVDTRPKQLLRQRLLMERPDLISTTYHMDLNPFIEVAEEMGIPLLHVPTDLDVKMVEIFGKKSPSYAHFKTLLPDNNEATWETTQYLSASKVHFEMVEEEGVNKHEVAGIALRPEFYIERGADEIAAIKKERGIDPKAKVVLVLSGGNGQELPYPDMLMNGPDNGQKYHMIVVAGGNTAAGAKLKKKKKAGARFIRGKNRNVTVEVAEDPAAATRDKPYFIGASEMARLQAIADVAITKPGGLSIGELLQTGVPMIPDRRVTPMAWEDFNIEVVKEAQRGLPYTGKENFVCLIDEVAALGKKPKIDRSKWLTEQMTEMIANAEDATDKTMVQHRKYRSGG